MENLIKKAASYIKNMVGNKSGPIQQDNEDLFKFIKEIWEKCENKGEYVKKMFSYWNGFMSKSLVQNMFFPEQSKTNYNIIKSITETKIKNMLDAQFRTAVIPDYGSFFDINAMKDVSTVADILTDCLRAIEKQNNMDCIEEKVARYGELCGFGSSQVSWEKQGRPDGEVKITFIPSEDLRWNKNASQGNISAIGYLKSYIPSKAKELFGRPDGENYDESICRQIDELVEDEGKSDGHKNQSGAVLNYVDTSNNTGGRAFIEAGSNGIQSNKIVTLITLYLLDDSVYAPEEKDTQDELDMKQEYKKAFPNGRKIVFSASEGKKVILLDELSEDGFKNLGNIDIYNHTYTNHLEGKGSQDDIAPIQDRIDGLFFKYREKVSGDFDTLLGPDDLFDGDNKDIVRSGYTKVTGYNATRVPTFISSNGIAKSAELLANIESFVKGAYELAHINQTMMSGEQPSGITSGEQVERLQESPMVDIRAQQRNFKNWKIAVSEKCLQYVINNYDTKRFIGLSTNIDGAKYVQIDTSTDETTGQQQKILTLYREAQNGIQKLRDIQFNKNWKFKVDVTAGTEIPRSRRERARLVDEITASPVMQSGNIPLIEQYLEAKDFPNRRALISLLKQQQDDAAKNPPKLTLDKIIENPPMCTAAANLFKSLMGFSKAQGQMLAAIGLDPSTDTITSAPAQQITSKSQVKDIAAIVPQQASENLDQIKFANRTALEMENKNHLVDMKKSELLAKNKPMEV